MSILVQDSPELRRISVLGSLLEDECKQELSQVLEQRETRRLELTFFDARTLPGGIMEKLLELKAASVPMKIYVYHTYLLHHLMRFKLPALGIIPSLNLSILPEITAIVLGGSADSLDKILTLITVLPPSNIVVFIVQHIQEHKPNYLDKLLQVRTEYTVAMPQHMADIVPGTIYIAPPGRHMKVAHGKVYLTQDKKIQFARPSIDVLFNSVAEEFREHCLGLLLCGYGTDGVEGLTHIKRLGGCALVENSTDCAARTLTDAGAANHAGHFVLSLAELCCFVVAAIAGRSLTMTTQLIELLLAAINSRYGFDYQSYQNSTVKRRLDNLCGKIGAPDFFTLQREILTNQEVFERLFLELSINITAFFRHPEQFRLLREKILPYLDSFSCIKIWSVGCANGKEAYSLAILLDELGMLDKTQIFATDINPYQLEEGKNGLYSLENLQEARRNYTAGGGHGQLDDWFINNNGYLKTLPRLSKHVQFYPHSLVHDGVFNEFQLILCRNVMIYFCPILQARTLELFAHSLHQDGFLILGPSENINLGEGEQFFSIFEGFQKAYRWSARGQNEK